MALKIARFLGISTIFVAVADSKPYDTIGSWYDDR